MRGRAVLVRGEGVNQRIIAGVGRRDGSSQPSATAPRSRALSRRADGGGAQGARVAARRTAEARDRSPPTARFCRWTGRARRAVRFAFEPIACSSSPHVLPASSSRGAAAITSCPIPNPLPRRCTPFVAAVAAAVISELRSDFTKHVCPYMPAMSVAWTVCPTNMRCPPRQGPALPELGGEVRAESEPQAQVVAGRPRRGLHRAAGDDQV